MKRTAIKRRTPVKKRNAKRKASEWKRCYHSKARVEFVKGLPCSACGVVGYSENAHVLGNGGLSRKAGYETIAPLCRTRFRPIPDGRAAYITNGCHERFDRLRSSFDKHFPDFDPEQAARATQRAYEDFCGSPRREER